MFDWVCIYELGTFVFLFWSAFPSSCVVRLKNSSPTRSTTSAKRTTCARYSTKTWRCSPPKGPNEPGSELRFGLCFPQRRPRRCCSWCSWWWWWWYCCRLCEVLLLVVAVVWCQRLCLCYRGSTGVSVARVLLLSMNK